MTAEIHEILAAVDEKLDRLEERRNRTNAEKMDAWERLFNVIIDTKIATVSDLINKLQQEKNEQYNENKQKLEKYYDQLVELKNKLNELSLTQDTLKGDVNVVKGASREIERILKDQEASVRGYIEWKTRVDMSIEEHNASIKSISGTVEEVKEWKQTFWYKYLATGIVLVLAAVEFFEKIWEWIKAGLTSSQ